MVARQDPSVRDAAAHSPTPFVCAPASGPSPGTRRMPDATSDTLAKAPDGPGVSDSPDVSEAPDVLAVPGGTLARQPRSSEPQAPANPYQSEARARPPGQIPGQIPLSTPERRPRPVRRRRRRGWFAIKTLLWAACLLPFGLLLWWGFHDQLTANPIERITRWTGRWTLVLLLVTLAVTPVRRLTGWNRLIRVRRLFGLFAFFYGILHFLTYLVVDQFFAWGVIAEDIFERPYITVGFTGLVLLVPLAATSTKAMIRRLGGKRWQRLHRLVYVTATLGVLHFLWLVKADTREPLIFGAILLALFALRIRRPRRPRTAERQKAGS